MSEGPNGHERASGDESLIDSSPTTGRATAVSEETAPRKRAHTAPKASRWAKHKAKRARQSKFRRRTTRVGEALVLLVVIVVGASGVYLYARLHAIARINVNVTPVAKGVEDILLVGSTDRCAVAPAKNFENFVKQCEDGVNGINSDVIMILRLVPNETPTLLSIPRDTFVPDARSGGLSNKIDAALADGPNQLVQAIEQDFGIPINHYVVLNFETFANIVHALGGITMYFPTTLMDQQSGLLITHRGCLHISGAEALALVRSRHLSYDLDRATGQWLGYDGSGDLGRIERVHIFLNVLGAQVAKRGLGNPLTDNSLLSAIAPDLTVDSSFGSSEMIHLALSYHTKIASAKELTLPIVEDTSTYEYKGYPYGLVVFPSEPADQKTIDTFMGGTPAGESVSPASISVSVRDGSDSPAASTATAAALRTLGYKVTDGGSQVPVGPVAETEVVYSSAAHLADAERVLRSLTGLVVLTKAPTFDGADVSVIVGSNVSVGSTPNGTTVAARSSASAGSATATSALTAVLDDVLLSATGITPTLTTANPALTAPTNAAPQIAPYDPRACPSK